MKFLEPFTSPEERARQTVERLLGASKPTEERRLAERQSYPCSTTIGVGERGVLRKPVSIRDISEKGTGLVHTSRYRGVKYPPNCPRVIAPSNCEYTSTGAAAPANGTAAVASSSTLLSSRAVFFCCVLVD